jgi:adenosylcobinamide amidohydrolase
VPGMEAARAGAARPCGMMLGGLYTMTHTNWEVLLAWPSVTVRRRGRHLVADLLNPHHVLSTSARNGGWAEHVRHLVNHQSCEGSGHEARARMMHEQGQERYHDTVCREIDLPEDLTATMGTAANMNYAAVVVKSDESVSVAAIVTAGVATNAVCAGDPATWRETPEGFAKIAAVAGTINTMLLMNTPVAAGALARTAITMTEGKSAALQRLAVPSCYSADLATGTGTDQFCVAAPQTSGKPLTSGSPHMKFGEITGAAVRDATLEALRWQNGLESSLTRGVFHALGRYGVREATIFDDLAAFVIEESGAAAADAPVILTREDFELLRKNHRSAFYEPLVGASAHALATVLDRIRHGTIPASTARDALAQQAASLAANLAAAPERWAEFRQRLLRLGTDDPKRVVLAALALGWSEKWKTR